MYGKRMSKAERKRRAIEFVGNLISRLFGNPGPEDWKQNTKNILAMKSAIERQRENSVILHDDIDQNRHAINAQNENLRHVSREVINNVNRLDNVDNALTELESFLELETMFESNEDILESLDDIRRDARTGRCNEKGLNPDFLVEHLRRVESNKAGIAPIFASWEWQKYYSFELCTLAIHDDEVWITMRIPIINIADQLVRAIPMSNQHWIRDRANELGIDVTLFKYKQLDTFMIMSKSNLETCSKLGTMRVCAIRKTKFREANPYVAPIDIGHDRIVILSNMTNSDAELEVKSICGMDVTSIQLFAQTVLRLPVKCAIIAKTFEISRAATNTEVTDSLNIGIVEKISTHAIVAKKELDQLLKPISDLTTSRNDFDSNNNRTIADLTSVKTVTFTNTETMLIASSSSMGVLASCLAVMILICYLKNRNSSNSNSNDHVVVVVDKTLKKKKINEQPIEENYVPESENDSITCDDKDTDKTMQQQQQLLSDSRKPLFQRKH